MEQTPPPPPGDVYAALVYLTPRDERFIEILNNLRAANEVHGREAVCAALASHVFVSG